MTKDWILQTKETRRKFSNSTWVPLRAICESKKGDVQEVGYTSEFFGCNSIAFPPEYKDLAETLEWSSIGITLEAHPYAFDSGHHKTIDQYEWNEKEPIGFHLIFDHPQPVIGGCKWIINPDLIVALRLIKEKNSWIRPEEDFVEVIRESFDDEGNHVQIEIKKEFLIDYLAARNLSLRLTYYRQRVENVEEAESSEYAGLESYQEERDQGRFELLIRGLNEVYGGSWASFRVWRTDVDEEDDAPVMGPETNENTESESSQGIRDGYRGIRVEGEFWRNEWIEHQGISTRVRYDKDPNLPTFIVETDGAVMPSVELDNEDIGRWLWFRSNIVNELLKHRGFSLKWYTAETGCICSTSGYRTHFGINSADLITVYAYDVAKLPSWEQRIWAAHNVVLEGKVSAELLDSQVKVQPASTHAVEDLLFKVMRMLEASFKQKLNVDLFSHDINDSELLQQISRFASTDRTSLLRLAKDLVRVFTDRLNVKALRQLSNHKDKNKLGSNKLLQDIVAQKIGEDRAYKIFGVIIGVYEMRLGDAHLTSSKIEEAIKLAGIDENQSFLRQGEQLIFNLGQAIGYIGYILFGELK
ncbi:hypothetical protein HYE53_06840 [Aggregatibacter actinomycetemcomitans]|uniref:hypothetical protein n=1 Tax=Aggregatibacter actinomycetemcomitans TaxID=714 RepID=UPI00197BD5B5|nr:hypothetical protein [Aggregatibacter actinomycetemcomitans]MBN6070802.1 hypothetical protein [Aggregatibacter actinomycetemcomitans]